MLIKLTQLETQALLNAALNQEDDLNERIQADDLSIGWRILLPHFKTGVQKLRSQYFNQLDKE